MMDLPVVEMSNIGFFMNCDNQMMIIKVNKCKDNTKWTRHVKRHLKFVRKLSSVGHLFSNATSSEQGNANVNG
jgi:hypothetical protein